MWGQPVDSLRNLCTFIACMQYELPLFKRATTLSVASSNMGCDFNVTFMNLESHIINISGNSEFSSYSEIEIQSEICEGRGIIAPVAWYISDIAQCRKSAISVSSAKAHHFLYGRMVTLVFLTYSSCTDQIRCTQIFSKNCIKVPDLS